MRTAIDGISSVNSRRSIYDERRLAVSVRKQTPQSTDRSTYVFTARRVVSEIASQQPVSQSQVTKTIRPSLDNLVARPANNIIESAKETVRVSPEKSHSKIEESTPKKQHWFVRPHVVRWSFSGLALIVLVATGLLGYQTWLTNNQAKAFYDKPASSAVSADSQLPDGGVPSEAPVSDDAKRNYSVAPDMPRIIKIGKIGVDARVLRLSVTNSGAIQAPSNIWDTGWYEGSAKPGEDGNAFIDGHVTGPTMSAVFTGLKTLQNGEKISIERGDGSILEYAVVGVRTEKVEDINMATVLAGPGGDKQTLTLMTCGGNLVGEYSYDSRVIVTAERTN